MSSPLSQTMQAAFHCALAPEALRALSDEQLLDEFVHKTGPAAEAAFQSLVNRHGPMVWGVCRNVLDQLHDSEDAFQATFLSLAQNAATIRNRRSLGGWLHEVAHRVAIRLRTRIVRQRELEKGASQMPAVSQGDENELTWDEIRALLHEEIDRLPENYRRAVLLCYFEDHTNEEAARILRWPVGTVKGRMSRARELLRSRLSRHGVSLLMALLAVQLSRTNVFAEIVPLQLVKATASLGIAASRGGESLSLVPAHLLELADGCSPKRSLAIGPLAGASVFAFVVVALFIGFYMVMPSQGNMTGNSLTRAAAAPSSCHRP
jgi:polysaccharide biosynthesis/export protein